MQPTANMKPRATLHQSAPSAPPKTDELSAAQRAALADYELLTELEMLADLEVARYLDLLRLEED